MPWLWYIWNGERYQIGHSPEPALSIRAVSMICSLAAAVRYQPMDVWFQEWLASSIPLAAA